MVVFAYSVVAVVYPVVGFVKAVISAVGTAVVKLPVVDIYPVVGTAVVVLVMLQRVPLEMLSCWSRDR